METEKLYYADPFLTDFTATVLDCQPGKNGYLVTLDRTAFYPEGGGQPADHGVLDGATVTDVHEKNGVILHNVDRAVEIGKTVAGAIDWSRRFDHMQQHSGEHICSGLICERFHCDNVGFHMGADIVTIDFNADISWEELLEIEAKANQYLYENHPIDIQFHRGAELEAIDYRSKKALEGDVRIVSFPGADCCACCGTHVLRSGQVGLVKFLSVQKFREGVRIELLCGKRALEYLSRTWEQAKAIGQRLSEATGKRVEAMVYGDGAFKDPAGKIWELADPVVSPGYTSGLVGTPNELKLKYLADNDFAGLDGEELRQAIKGRIAAKDGSSLVGNMVSEGTTPRRLTDLIGSLCDLTSGSGDKGTPIVYIQGYFDNYTND